MSMLSLSEVCIVDLYNNRLLRWCMYLVVSVGIQNSELNEAPEFCGISNLYFNVVDNKFASRVLHHILLNRHYYN